MTKQYSDEQIVEYRDELVNLITDVEKGNKKYPFQAERGEHFFNGLKTALLEFDKKFPKLIG